MKRHYSDMIEAGDNPHTKPYKGVKQEDWDYMINDVWASKKHVVAFERLHEEATELGTTTITQEQMTIDV
ncbi:hypothetical protein U1Q18_007971 [Sarracenia purpurea var. burkii]